MNYRPERYTTLVFEIVDPARATDCTAFARAGMIGSRRKELEGILGEFGLFPKSDDEQVMRAIMHLDIHGDPISVRNAAIIRLVYDMQGFDGIGAMNLY